MERGATAGRLFMTTAPVISNASPLIALNQIGQLPLLQQLFAKVFIPRAVALEVAPSVNSLPSWIEPRTLSQPIGPRILSASLGAGESESICLALEMQAQLTILDD